MDKFGRLFGVGTDKKLYTKDNIQGNWTQNASSGEKIKLLTVDINKGVIYVLDTDNSLYKKVIPNILLSLKTLKWSFVCPLPKTLGLSISLTNVVSLVTTGYAVYEFDSPAVLRNPLAKKTIIQDSCCVVSVCTPISFGNDPDF